MSELNTLIVDDERLVRSELRNMLEPRDDVTVVGEAADATEAEGAVEEHDPDLLLLDVQMPDATGFELLERLDEVPHVVFVTAYDEYAIRAFEVNALDYLVKPVLEERLTEALDVVQDRVASSEKTSGPAPQPEDEDREKPDTLRAEDKAFVKDGERCWFVRLGKVRLFEAAGNYTRLYFDGEEPLIHRSLSYLEERLDPDQFFRASRQHILNLEWVEDMDSRRNGKLAVILASGKEVELSHRRSRTFREEMSL